MKTNLLSFCFLLLVTLPSFSQNNSKPQDISEVPTFSKNSIFVGSGVGILQLNDEDINRVIFLFPLSFFYGFTFNLGYQRIIWKDRLRLSTDLDYFQDKRYKNEPFVSVSSKIGLDFDLFRIKNFSFFVGAGIGNRYVNLKYVSREGDEYNWHRYYFTMTGSLLGVRYYSRNNRFAYELRVYEFDVAPFFKGNMNWSFFENALLRGQVSFNLK